MRIGKTLWLAAALASAATHPATAEITTVALYRCGEEGDVPAVALRATVGTNAAIVYNNGSAVVTNGTAVYGSPKFLQTQRMAWSPGFAYLDGRPNNWGMAAWVRLPPGPLTGATYTRDAVYFLSNGGWNSGLGLRYANATTTYWAFSENVAVVDPELWDTWVHVAVVYNGSNRKQLYVNGAQIGADLAANASWNTTGAYRQFSIGTWNWNNYSGRFVWPAIDEIRVFSFAEGAFRIEDLLPPPGLTGPLLLIR